MTPVIYKWLQTNNTPTDVIITTNPAFTNDYRINFLKKFSHVRIFYINDIFKKYSLPYFFNKYYFRNDVKYDRYISKYIFVRKRADKIISQIAKKLFKDMDRGIIVFDWLTTYFVKQILKISNKKNFVTVSLPHGDMPYVSLLETINDLDYKGLDQYKDSDIFYYFIVPNKQNLKRYEKYVKSEKLKILGSSRYSDEWMKIIAPTVPEYKKERSSDKLKIVFFLRNTGYPIFWDEVVRTIKLIVQFKEIYLIVKHHPRNRSAKKLTNQLINSYPEVKVNLNKNLKFIYGSVNSGSLLNWADIVIDLGTSVTWEAVKQNKPVFMIEYLYANYSTIASYIKNSEIKCRDQLYDTLQEFIKNKNVKFYNESERRTFIKEIIDVPDKHVLERYAEFLKSCLHESEKNNLKQKLQNQKLTLGSWITIGDPIIAEIMANSGFEWLTVDMEHSAITLDIAQNLIRTIELCGCIPLVRVHKNDPFTIKRVMDAGAYGVIVPMVNSKEDAEKAVNAVKYPPEGNRGVGLARAQDYGFNFEGYKKWLEKESVVIVQIEHIDAIKNLKSILQTKGVDGFIVGPYDISGSMDIPGDFKNPEFQKNIKKIMEIAKEMKKTAGFHVIPPDKSEVQKYIDLGYRFIAISLDTLFLGTMASNLTKEFK